VPEDLIIEGGEEKFNVAVVYDTMHLYGRVEATREIVIVSEKTD